MRISASKTELCEGDSLQLNIKGGLNIKWLSDNSLQPGIAGYAWARPLKNTTYSAVISIPECQLSDTLSVTVIVNPGPLLHVRKSVDINCTTNTTELTATGATTYRWSPDSTLQFAKSAKAIASPLKTTVYHVEGRSVKGCVANDSIEVQVLNHSGTAIFDLPNSFTPNNDGHNDCFGVKSWGYITNFQLTVFNRWGQIVFKTTDPKACWNGIFHGIEQASGNFPYIVKATTICGPVEKKGWVLLIR